MRSQLRRVSSADPPVMIAFDRPVARAHPATRTGRESLLVPLVRRNPLASTGVPPRATVAAIAGFALAATVALWPAAWAGLLLPGVTAATVSTTPVEV